MTKTEVGNVLTRVVSPLFVAVMAFGVVACDDDMAAVSSPVPDSSAQIVLSPRTVTTRGLHELTYSEMKLYGFGVFAAHTGAGDFNTTSRVGDYLYNHKFTVNEGADKDNNADDYWVGNPAVFWPLAPSDKLSFFAYAPYDGSQSQMRIEDYANGRGPFIIDYYPSSDLKSQLDFSVADAATTLNLTRADNNIPLTFHHALTKVLFHARYEGTPPSGYKVRVDEIRLNNVVGHKRLRYDLNPDDDKVFEWLDVSGVTASTSYHLLRTATEDHLTDEYLCTADEASAARPEGYLPLQLINGVLYLLPQYLTASATIDLTYSFVADDKICAQFTRNILLPSDVEWNAGRVMNYKITIPLGNSSEISVVAADGGALEEEPVVEWKPSSTTTPSETIIE